MGVIGKPIPRVDGPAKVMGRATYAGEFRPHGLLHAAMVRSPIPHGRVTRIDASKARAFPGVVEVVTHENAPRLAWEPLDPAVVDPDAGEQIRPFQSNEVQFYGEPVALVVADSLETARMAAALVEVEYERTPGVGVTFDIDRAREPTEQTSNYERGDAESAFASAPRKIDAEYLQPRLHHNAMELHVTIAYWEDGKLTLWDKSQWVDNVRSQISKNFGMDEGDIRVISPFVGGAFGSALRCWPHVTMAAMAAKMVGRPVRLELTRREHYDAIGYRPHTLQRVKIGASEDGRIASLIQTAWGQTSSYEEYTEGVIAPVDVLYDTETTKTVYRLVEMDTSTPTPMRGPGAVTGVYATEMAIDEIADACGMDPLEFRLRNYAERDQKQDLPFSSKELRACYETGAKRFGWEKRPLQRGMMREGRELIGYGMATAIWHADRAPSQVRVTLYANGSAMVRTAASDMGPGTYTSMTQVAADRLGLPVERVIFELGDTSMPMAPVHGGSITMASVGAAVAAGCDALREKLAELGGEPGDDLAESLRRLGRESLEVDGSSAPGEESKNYSSHSFGAVFAEVRVDPELGTIRCPRLVGAYDGGVIVNPNTARSQAIGGMVMGVGMALMEGVEWDERLGRVMNANLAEYLVPVNNDIEVLDAVFVESEDRIVSPLGTKGIAEIALCGVAPAIGNAVWHATGLRLRELPLTPDRLLTMQAA